MLHELQIANFVDCKKGPYVVVIDINGKNLVSAIDPHRLRGHISFDHRLEGIIGFRVREVKVTLYNYQTVSFILGSNKLGALVAYNPFRLTIDHDPNTPSLNNYQFSNVIGYTRLCTEGERYPTQTLTSDLNPRFNFKQTTHIEGFDWEIYCPNDEFRAGDETPCDVFIVIEFFKACHC